jgi:hypothetical protein
MRTAELENKNRLAGSGEISINALEETKPGDAGTRRSCESSLLGDPDTKFSYGKRGTGTKEEKRANQNPV